MFINGIDPAVSFIKPLSRYHYQLASIAEFHFVMDFGFCQTLAKLERFKKTISSKLSAPSSSDSKGNSQENETATWMANRLTFIPESSEKVCGHTLGLHLIDHIFCL